MSKNINIVVSCGTGMATSTIVEQEIKEILKEENINANIIKCSTMALDSNLENADVVFLSTNYKLPDTIKWMSVFSLISGINEDEEREKIRKLLHEVADS